MKPAAVVCVLALVLALTPAASAAPDALRGSSRVGSVFVTNPVQSLGDESLTNQKDADAAVPQAAYHEVALTNVDGSGFLRGDFADVVTETGKAAFSSTNTFPTSTRATSRTACVPSTRTCTIRRIWTARCTTTARSGRARCGTSAGHSGT